MNDQRSDNDAAPALPLDYFERHSGPWLAVMRWAAWAAVAYAAMTIAAAVPTIVYYLVPSLTRSPRIVLVGPQTVIMILPGVASSGLLLAGALTVLRRVKIGRSMLIWSCAALIACGSIQFLFTLYLYFYSLRGSYRQFGPPFVVYQCISQFFTMLRTAFVPTTFILLFCKREVKEACGS